MFLHKKIINLLRDKASIFTQRIGRPKILQSKYTWAILFGSFVLIIYACSKSNIPYISNLETSKSQPVKYTCAVNVFIPSNVSKKISPKDWEKFLHTFDALNVAFKRLGVTFYVDSVYSIDSVYTHSYPTINQVAGNAFEIYGATKRYISKKENLNIWILQEHPEEIITKTENSIAVSRKHGFADVFTDDDEDCTYKTIVLNENSIFNPSILIHEMGHIFGLYHTFRDVIAGYSYNRCDLTNDKICDTDLDPGDVFSTTIDYYNCEMRITYRGITYTPDIQNYMSYFFGYCYMKEKRFTEGQYKRMEEVLLYYLNNCTLINVQ